MSRICELTGKGRQVGHNVSHANNKTKKTFLPNLQNVTLMSEKLDRSFKFRVSTQGLRSVEHNGGLDNWLLKTGDEKLPPRALTFTADLTPAAAAPLYAVISALFGRPQPPRVGPAFRMRGALLSCGA